MDKIGLFYGTYTGITGMIAEKIADELGRDNVDLHNICCDGEQMDKYDKLIIGTGMLYETFQFRGAKFIGFWPTVGYDFTSPLPLLDHDHFVGLAIDEDNQSDLTDERIKKWCEQIRPAFGLKAKD